MQLPVIPEPRPLTSKPPSALDLSVAFVPRPLSHRHGWRLERRTPGGMCYRVGIWRRLQPCQHWIQVTQTVWSNQTIYSPLHCSIGWSVLWLCKKEGFSLLFQSFFFFNAWHLLFISASPLFATGKPNSNVKRAAALRPTQVLRRIKLLLQRLSWHRMNYDTRVSTHIISSRGGGTVNINASVWHPFLLVIMSIQQNT